MRVAEAMTRDVHLAAPDQSIIDAAKMMADCDCGVIPVSEHDRLVGIITDRDIVIRALAQGKGGDTRIRDVMSAEVKYCFEDDDIDDVARNMGDIQVRRLPVVDQNKRLTGIVTLGDIAQTPQTQASADALTGISERPSEHTSSGMRQH